MFRIEKCSGFSTENGSSLVKLEMYKRITLMTAEMEKNIKTGKHFGSQ